MASEEILSIEVIDDKDIEVEVAEELDINVSDEEKSLKSDTGIEQ